MRKKTAGLAALILRRRADICNTDRYGTGRWRIFL